MDRAAPYLSVSGTTWGSDALGREDKGSAERHGSPPGTVPGGCAGPVFQHDSMVFSSVDALVDVAARSSSRGSVPGTPR